MLILDNDLLDRAKRFTSLTSGFRIENAVNRELDIRRNDLSAVMKLGILTQIECPFATV